MAVRNGDISLANSLSTLAGSRSGPPDFPGLSFCSNFRTPSHVTLISGIDGKGMPSGVGMLVVSSLVHVDSYWRLSISALSFALAWSVPLSLRGAIPLESFLKDLMYFRFLSISHSGEALE